MSARRILRSIVHPFVQRAGYELIPRSMRVNPHWPHLRECLEVHGVTAAIDVGAHEGLYVEELRRIGFSGPVLSFEPVPANLEVLRPKVDADPLWEVAPVALDRDAGRQTFHIMEDTRFSSFHKPSEWCDEWSKGGSRIRAALDVEVERLDERFFRSSIADHSSILLKVDAQGADLRILEGAAGMLDRVSVIQLELSVRPLYDEVASFDEAMDLLDSLGFGLSHLTPGGVTQELAVLECDTIFVRLANDQPPVRALEGAEAR